MLMGSGLRRLLGTLLIRGTELHCSMDNVLICYTSHTLCVVQCF